MSSVVTVFLLISVICDYKNTFPLKIMFNIYRDHVRRLLQISTTTFPTAGFNSPDPRR